MPLAQCVMHRGVARVQADRFKQVRLDELAPVAPQRGGRQPEMILGNPRLESHGLSIERQSRPESPR